MVDLKQFVSETIKQVLSGVVAAQQHAREHGGFVCPVHLPMRHEDGSVYRLSRRKDVEHMIEFDVAITTSDDTKSGGGIGIFVGAGALGAKGESTRGSEYVNRVKFAVPIVYPKQLESQSEREAIPRRSGPQTG